MWFFIGTLIGPVWNIRDEKKHPEIKARRQKEWGRGMEPEQYVYSLIVLLILAGMVYWVSRQLP